MLEPTNLEMSASIYPVLNGGLDASIHKFKNQKVAGKYDYIDNHPFH
jgi:hypothetical protein